MEYKIELLSPQQLQCGEGPVWMAKNEKFFWTDSLGESIFCYDNLNQIISLYYHGLHSASLTLHNSGGLLSCGKEGITLLSYEKKLYRFNNETDGVKARHLNDIIADPKGRVFSGQECFKEGSSYQTGYLFRLDIDGSLHIIDEGFHIANGMGFSPDCGTFYLADTILRTIYCYDYNADSGNISNKKELIQFKRDDGLPDGLTVDSNGFLWIAMFLGNKILCVDPGGTIDASKTIQLPFAQTTSLTFGGKDLKELYITSAALFWETNLAPGNHDFKSERGGGVYMIKTSIEGKKEFQAAITN